MKQLLIAGLFLALATTQVDAQINAGNLEPEPNLPFDMAQVATFNLPWRIAFLPDGRMLITEKPGGVWLVTQQGAKTQVSGAPAVLQQGQGGMLGVLGWVRVGGRLGGPAPRPEGGARLTAPPVPPASGDRRTAAPERHFGSKRRGMRPRRAPAADRSARRATIGTRGTQLRRTRRGRPRAERGSSLV